MEPMAWVGVLRALRFGGLRWTEPSVRVVMVWPKPVERSMPWRKAVVGEKLSYQNPLPAYNFGGSSSALLVGRSL